jgi:hypothetical protein
MTDRILTSRWLKYRLRRGEPNAMTTDEATVPEDAQRIIDAVQRAQAREGLRRLRRLGLR